MPYVECEIDYFLIHDTKVRAYNKLGNNKIIFSANEKRKRLQSHGYLN